MALFGGKSSSPELQSMIDDLARSYMRGHRLADPGEASRFREGDHHCSRSA